MNGTSRRQFLGGAAASLFIGGCASRVAARKVAANDKVNVAVIGCGLIAKTTNVPGFLKDPRCRVTTVCDVVELALDYFYGGRGSNFGAECFVGGDGNYRRDVCGWRVIRDMVNKRYGDTACRWTLPVFLNVEIPAFQHNSAHPRKALLSSIKSLSQS